MGSEMQPQIIMKAQKSGQILIFEINTQHIFFI
jgi:hypothetical protein